MATATTTGLVSVGSGDARNDRSAGTEAVPPSPPTNRYVPEIAGLRTIALLLVASFHIWLGRVSGGVDIFLFIGAYLMTRSLADRAEAGNLTRPITYIVRKFARLLPAALAAIVLTVVAVLIFIAPHSWSTLFDQALASGTYWMNFWLQGEAVDYYAANRHESSFFQHFWSLSLQGQVFVLWPFVHLLCEWIARKTGIRPRSLLLGVFAVVSIASFSWALHLTSVSPEFAYFDLPARLWEFALGSVLALVIPWLRFPGHIRRIMTSIGLIGAVLCGFVMPVDAAYPGWPAMWPVFCAVLVIAAADAPRSTTQRPDPILGSRILQRIGGYTYALYLTHWPILILYANLVGGDTPSAIDGLVLLLISAALAVVITHAVERPVTRWMSREQPMQKRRLPRLGKRTLAVFTVGAVLATGIGVGGEEGLKRMQMSALDAIWLTDVSDRGPQANPNEEFDALVPADMVVETPPDIRGDWCPLDKWWGGLACLEDGADVQSGAADRRIVVIGNSHAMMYTGMLWETMQQHPSWHIRAYGSPGCIAPGPDSTPTEQCAKMWETAIEFVTETQPDLLVIVGTVSRVGDTDLLHNDTASPYKDTVLGDHVPTVAHVTQQTTTEVVVIRDTPRFPTAPYFCAVEHGHDAEECIFKVPEDPDALPQFITQIEEAGGVWVDVNGAVCPDGTCRPTLGGIVTYLDDNHLTATMSRSLAQVFADQVHPHISWWPASVWSKF
ncbi:acyltransferase [Pseudoclavibacter endophyticus]|nr:acyltransferase family protein [Pseudoclavibacter endophyticus]GGA65400.1 acyltransferase [Pseudoclavibacter endophyticus]